MIFFAHTIQPVMYLYQTLRLFHGWLAVLPYTLLLCTFGFFLTEVGFPDYSVGYSQTGRGACLFFSLPYSYNKPVWSHVAKSRTGSFLVTVLAGSSEREACVCMCVIYVLAIKVYSQIKLY